MPHTVNDHQLLHNFLVESKVGMLLTNANGITLWANEYLLYLSGYSLNEMVGRTPGEILQGEDTDLNDMQEIRMGLASGKPFECTILNYKKNGSPFWIKLQISPIRNENGELTHFIGIQTDVTDLKKQEEKILRFTKELKSHNQRLEGFNHIVSHNLINQINNIHCQIQATSRQLPVQQSDLLTQSSCELIRTVNHLKQLLRTQTDEQDWLNDHIDLNQLIVKTINSYQHEIERLGVIINLACHETIQIRSNPAFLESILQNLISNAIKYRKQNETLRIDIYLTRTTENIRIEIVDNGRGIDLSAYGENLFDIFNSIDASPISLGLGLYMVKTQVLELGGTVNVESKVGHGSRFAVTLPVSPEAITVKI